MDRDQLTAWITSHKLSEVEAAIRIIWYIHRIDGQADVRYVDVFDFFAMQSIGHPNRSRLKTRLASDRRVLRSGGKGGVRLRVLALNDLDNELGAAKAHVHPTAPLIKSLEAQASKLAEAQTRSFVQEAIQCIRNDTPRAAIIMSWCGAMSVLQQYVYDRELDAFNVDALQNGILRSSAKSLADMRDISKESHFLESLARISIIDGATKRTLKRCLDRRNDVGHPSEVRLSDAAVADHLESLILNVFERFGG